MARPSLLVLVGLLVLVPALSAGAAAEPLPFHVPLVVSGTFTLEPEAPEPYVCLVAAPGVDRVVMRAADGEEKVFTLEEGRSACGRLAGGDHTIVEGGEVRLVALAVPPNHASNPGVYLLLGRGVSLMVDGLSPEGRIGMNVDAGHAVSVFDLEQVEVIRFLEGPTEEGRAVRGTDGTRATRFLVAVDASAPGGEVRVEWDDPQWFRPEPTLGHIGVIVAALLFVVFYRPAGPDARRV